jgi:replicative DNA helicase
LIDPDAIIKVANFLRPEDFFRERHAWLYDVMLTLHERHEPLDFVTVASMNWNAAASWRRSAALPIITELIGSTPTSINVDFYARIVERTALLRRLITAAGEIATLAYDESRDVDEVIDRAESLIFGVSEARIHRDLQPLRAIMGNGGGPHRLSHAQPGHAHGRAHRLPRPRPAAGRHAEERSDHPGGAPGHGQDLAGAQRRAQCGQALPGARRRLQPGDEQRPVGPTPAVDGDGHRQPPPAPGPGLRRRVADLLEAANLLANTSIFIDDTPAAAVNEIRTKCRRLYSEHGLDMVLIDYMQLMSGQGGGRGGENRQQEISYISRSLKALARELNVPVIALSQLSRAVESRSDKRPMLSDLRESGCLAGDTPVFLADRGVYVPIAELVDTPEVQVASLNVATWRLENAAVAHAFCTGVKPLLRLTTQLGRTVRATGNHQFLTIHGWQRLDQLQPGARIALPRTLPSPTVATMNDGALALLGHLIGDGCTLPHHAIQYTTKDHDLAEIVVGLARDVFGNSIEPRIEQQRTWCQVFLAAAEHLTHGKRNPVAAWLDHLGVFGLRSHEKHVPTAVFAQPTRAIARFLCHLWSTDGCVRMTWGHSPRPAIYYASSSRRLAVDVQSLLLRCGINARIRSVAQATGYRTQWHVVVTGRDDVLRFAHEIGAVGDRKTKSLAEILNFMADRPANTNRDVIPDAAWRMFAVPAMAERGITSRQLQARMKQEYCGTTLYRQNMSRDRAQRVADIAGIGRPPAPCHK